MPDRKQYVRWPPSTRAGGPPRERSSSRRRVSTRVFEFCSGLVDLVVGVGHHRGDGHLRTLLCALVISLIAKNLPQVRNRGCQLRQPCPGIGTGREARDDGGAFRTPEPFEARREARERNSDNGRIAGVVVIANHQLEISECRERVTVDYGFQANRAHFVYEGDSPPPNLGCVPGLCLPGL